jgi:pimeloyl-ACP methyl ester carboxylesterase
MGGQIATLAAIKQQDKVAKLILVSPSGFEPYTAVEKQMLINLQLGVTASAQAFTMHKINYLIGFCNDHKMAADILKRLPVFQEESYIFGRMMLRSMESMLLESVYRKLDKVTVPCLVLAGKDDKVSPYSYLRSEEYYEIVSRQSRQLQKGRTVVFEPGCHFIQYQRPKTFNSIVVNFLQENDNNDTDKIKP